MDAAEAKEHIRRFGERILLNGREVYAVKEQSDWSNMLVFSEKISIGDEVEYRGRKHTVCAVYPQSFGLFKAEIRWVSK